MKGASAPGGRRAARAFLALLAALAFADTAAAQRPRPGRESLGEEPGEVFQQETELVDIPTAGALDYASFSARSRFFTGGGVVNHLAFGVFQRLNLGASLNVDRLIGSQGPVQLTSPELQVKLRFFDGSQTLPAVAAGFDGQGLFYDRVTKEYVERHRGLYLVGSKELLVKGLFLHAGGNISDFDSNSLFAFFGLNLNLEDKVAIMTEWDNVETVEESRWNAGLRVFATPFLAIDFAVREMGRAGRRVGGVKVEAERIVQMRYTGSF